MLVRFSVENWMLFRTAIEMSMMASAERTHREHLAVHSTPKGKRKWFSTVPIKGILGANGAGKSAFFKAMDFASRFIVVGTEHTGELISVRPFKDNDKPVRFLFEIMAGGQRYRYEFSVTKERVMSEFLYLIKAKKELLLFNRRGQFINVSPKVKRYLNLEKIGLGTRPNLLFLTNSVAEGIETFLPIHDWFRNKLKFVFSDNDAWPCVTVFNGESPIVSSISERIHLLDDGIVKIDGKEIPTQALCVNESDWAMIVGRVSSEGSQGLLRVGKAFYALSRQNGAIKTKELVFTRRLSSGELVHTDMSQESDGLRRLIGLCPIWEDLDRCARGLDEKVIVIDNLDEKLSHYVVSNMLEQYIRRCNPNSRSQLLFSCREMSVVSNTFFRNDESPFLM